MKLVAHTIKGLEEITLHELKFKVSGFELISAAPKKIIFEASCIPSNPYKFRTFDDLSIFISKFKLQRLEDICKELKIVNLTKYRDQLKKIRSLNTNFSITVSMYKNKRFDKEELISKVSEKISRIYGLTYTPFDHTNFDIRMNIEKDTCYFMVKVFPKSLFFRSYRKNSQKGAIRPSIAGAMLYAITKGKGGDKVVDNFCGSGTFLCEALLDGNEVYGGDISKSSVEAAKANLASIYPSSTSNIRVLDAVATKWQDKSFDIAISNLPWDKQIETSYITRLYSEAIREYKRILKDDGTICLIGAKPDLMIKHIKLNFGDTRREIKVLRIGYLGQMPSIVVSRLIEFNTR